MEARQGPQPSRTASALGLEADLFFPIVLRPRFGSAALPRASQSGYRGAASRVVPQSASSQCACSMMNGPIRQMI